MDKVKKQAKDLGKVLLGGGGVFIRLLLWPKPLTWFITNNEAL